ncbi:ribonuclease H-like domain-containing protein [Sanguibacter sp. Z1732]|uniref:ribonuclease H-like domain-containing protein n=1 Tax=Sanguibacter sp. Z1732 TaxID=3435412 RepID=UPI003D9C7DCB
MQFLEYVAERRARYPDMHVYHYADYEKAALRRLSLQHALGEDGVDELLRAGVLVDLYDVVQTSVQLSSKSYGLKALEPLYMGSDLRTGDITAGGASVVAYANYCMARDTGQSDEATRILASIEDYNHYDCRSTWRLRDCCWPGRTNAGYAWGSSPRPNRRNCERSSRCRRRRRSTTSSVPASPSRYAPAPSSARSTRPWLWSPPRWGTTAARTSSTGGHTTTG